MNGLTKLNAELVGDAALIFEAALNTKADELFHRFSADNEVSGGEITVPSRSTLMALALMDLVREGLAVDLDSTTGPRTELTLIASATEPNKICDGRGHKLPDGTVITVCCDPVIWSVIANTFGVPLDMGRKVRTRRVRRPGEKHHRQPNGCRSHDNVAKSPAVPPKTTRQHQRAHIGRPRRRARRSRTRP